MESRFPAEMKVQAIIGLTLVFIAGFILASNLAGARFSPNAAAVETYTRAPVCPMKPYLEVHNCSSVTYPEGSDFTLASMQAADICKRDCFSYVQGFVDACNDYCNVGHNAGTVGGQSTVCSVGNMSALLSTNFCEPTCYFDLVLQKYVCQAQGYAQYRCDCAAI